MTRRIGALMGLAVLIGAMPYLAILYDCTSSPGCRDWWLLLALSGIIIQSLLLSVVMLWRIRFEMSRAHHP